MSNFNSVNFNLIVGRASAVGRASDVAVEWEGRVLTWQVVFVGRANGGASGRVATGDILRMIRM